MRNIIFVSIFLLLASCGGSSPSKYNSIRVNKLDFSSDIVGLINIMADLPASSKIALLDIPPESREIMENLLEKTGFKVVKITLEPPKPAAAPAEDSTASTFSLGKSMLGRSIFNSIVKKQEPQPLLKPNTPVPAPPDPISFGKSVGADIVIVGKKELEGTFGSRYTLRVIKVENGELISLSRTYESNKFIFWVRRTMVYFNLPPDSRIAIINVPAEKRGIIDVMLDVNGFNVITSETTSLPPSDIKSFGKSIGADIVIAGIKAKDGSVSMLGVLGVARGDDARLANGNFDQFSLDDLTERTLAAPEVLGFIDTRDWQIYNINKIGNLVWMSQNLNYEIGEGKCFDDDVKNCRSYFGKLYKWDDAKNVCPNGWHLPSIEEWKEMADSTAFGKPTNFSFIIDYDINGGYSFWTSSETSKNEASVYYMSKAAGAFSAEVSAVAKNKSSYYSVRCVYNH